jgi:hypothetical protein
MNTPIVSEPDQVYPEAVFESAISSVVHALLDGMNGVVVVPRFGLDIAVSSEGLDGDRAALIEVKSFNGQRQGGIGFGNSRGDGPQVDLLLCRPSQMRLSR